MEDEAPPPAERASCLEERVEPGGVHEGELAEVDEDRPSMLNGCLEHLVQLGRRAQVQLTGQADPAALFDRKHLHRSVPSRTPACQQVRKLALLHRDGQEQSRDIGEILSKYPAPIFHRTPLYRGTLKGISCLSCLKSPPTASGPSHEWCASRPPRSAPGRSVTPS